MSEPQVVNPTQLQVEETPQAQVTEPAKPVPKVITKASIRKRVWNHFSENKLGVFPPHYGRIPNFADADQAAARILELDVFRSAKSIAVTPEKVVELVRIKTLSHEKDLYVPCPGFDYGMTKKIELVFEQDIKSIVSRRGMECFGRRVDFKEKIHIDLIVMGSVAVSEDGLRIGEGQGFVDLEYAMLKDLEAVDDKTKIVTIVHDSQVFDMPHGIFKKYDVPVDYILTPTRTIKVERGLPKPEGIVWGELTQRRLRNKSILKKLRRKYESEGKDTTLRKETKAEKRMRNQLLRPTRYIRSKPKLKIKNSAGSSPVQNEDGTSHRDSPAYIERVPSPKIFRRRKKYKHIDYSLRVSNIQRNVRVSELKNALREKGIKPCNISWKGNQGYCFLHYSKKQNIAVEGSDAINNVIEMIQELKLNSDTDKNLSVKVMEPITRIETVNVTAV
nr:methenyltetrahydrofolate synthase domain-containing protein [Leptinotarsa decemlineata]